MCINALLIIFGYNIIYSNEKNVPINAAIFDSGM